MNAERILGALVLVAVCGCNDFNLRSWRLPNLDLRSQSPEPVDIDKEFETNVETPMVGEYTSFAGLQLIELHGVGLVVGLNGTGGDPPPSIHRTRLYKEIQKRGIDKPNHYLQSASTAMVLIKAHLPPLVRKGDEFDIEVYLPPNSEATSLNGGWLLETRLSEQALVPGRGVLEGKAYAVAEGPILISTGVGEKDSLAGVLRRGRILGGGRALRERNMSLYLRNDYRSVRNSMRIANAIGRRFYDYNKHGKKEPLAEAKDDRKIELKILDRYKDNFPRYLQVIRSIALRETDVAQRVRIKKLEEQLHDPDTSERAAVQLEAIGQNGLPALKSGLKDPRLEVQFHSAVALAYLAEPVGVKVLAQAAREEPAFRVFALAAMASIDDSESILALRELLSERSAETRYGAFRALTTLNSHDPFIRGENLNDQFVLHVLETEGEPMVHLTNRRKAEVVLFGAEQRFVAPMVVRAGPHIMVTAHPGRGEVIVSRYEVGKRDVRETVSTRIADVIRTIASEKFGASFPDVAQMLVQADAQHNLPSRLEIDALPRPGRVYYRSRDDANRASNTRVGNKNLTPNLFSGGKDDDESGDEMISKPAERSRGTASLVDATSGSEERPAADKAEQPEAKFDLLRFFRREKKPTSFEIE